MPRWFLWIKNRTVLELCGAIRQDHGARGIKTPIHRRLGWGRRDKEQTQGYSKEHTYVEFCWTKLHRLGFLSIFGQGECGFDRFANALEVLRQHDGCGLNRFDLNVAFQHLSLFDNVNGLPIAEENLFLTRFRHISKELIFLQLLPGLLCSQAC